MAGKNKKKKKNKEFTITLNWIKITHICLFFLIALSWTFVLGVLIGRGYFDRYLYFFKRTDKKERTYKELDVSINPSELRFYRNVENVKNKNKLSFSSSAPKTFVFQVASFKYKDKAERIKNLLQKNGFDSKVVSKKVENETWYRVYVYFSGSFDKEIKFRDKLKKLGLGKPVVVERNR